MTRPTIRIADWGEFHATRRRAHDIALTIPSGPAPVVDVTYVQAVTGAFADELWTHLPEGAELVGMAPEVADVFADVAARRSEETAR